MIKGFKLEKQILEESLLKSSFTFGFELEAVAEASYYSDYDTSDDEGYYEDEEEDHYVESSEMSRAIDNNLTNLLNKNQPDKLFGTMQSDGSLSADDDDDFCFEWASPVMEYTPKNVQRTIKFLDGLSDIGIYTNNSCGFHHHLSWKGINERDMIWTYTNLIMDGDFVNGMQELQTRRGSSIRMNSDWAKTGPLSDLRNAIKEKDWVKALRFYNDDKYRLFRIHPYGTIEWRGPRKFLDYKNLEYIKDFYKKFNTLISKVIKCQEMKTILGTDITKEEFFNNLKNAQNSPDAPHPNSNMRDNMEFLYRTGTYRGDRRIRLKRDTTDKSSYISEKHMQALSKRPELLYNEIMKCKDLEGFAKLIRVNDLSNIFYKLSKNIVPAKDKAFLDKLLDIALIITDDVSEMGDFISENMVQLLDTKKLYERYKEIIKKSKDCVAFSRYIQHLQKENETMPYNEYFSLLRKYAINGDNPRSICDNCDLFVKFASFNDSYTDKELLSIVNLMLKLQFKLNYRTYVADSIIEVLNKVITNDKEKDKWDENLLGAMFEKHLPHFLAYLLPTKNEDILKGIVAVIKLQQYNSKFLCNGLKNTLKNWVD